MSETDHNPNQLASKIADIHFSLSTLEKNHNRSTVASKKDTETFTNGESVGTLATVVPDYLDDVDKFFLSNKLEHLIVLRDKEQGLYYRFYDNEYDMPSIVSLITKDLSEPYSIYTYRYFIHNWPKLCILAFTEDHECVGSIVCKLEWHHHPRKRGYIAMLAVEKEHRRKKIGSKLVKLVIELMETDGCDEVVLETEVTNKPAMQLYQQLGFCRDKRLFRYYLNGVDAYRLKLWLK